MAWTTSEATIRSQAMPIEKLDGSGASRHAIVAADMIRLCDAYEIVGFSRRLSNDTTLCPAGEGPERP